MLPAESEIEFAPSPAVMVSIPLPLFDGLELTLAHDAVARREAGLGAGVMDAIR